MKLVEFAFEITLEDKKKIPAKCIHFQTFWKNPYVLYFKNDNIENEPVRIVPIYDGKNIHSFELKLLRKQILQVTEECFNLIKG